MLKREQIEQLVHRFNLDVRRDAQIGLVFERALAGRWHAHLARLVDVWCTVMKGFARNLLYGHHQKFADFVARNAGPIARVALQAIATTASAAEAAGYDGGHHDLMRPDGYLTLSARGDDASAIVGWLQPLSSAG